MNELVRRIAITIGALLIFRVGSHIPIPLTGISAQSRLLSSGAIDRVSIFSLTLVPYVGAAILIQLVSVVWGKLSALERSGEAGGRRKIARITPIVTLLLASFQAFGVASTMQNISGLVAGGRTIQDVEPGEATADYLDRIVSLTTVLGAAYLTVMLLIPELVVARSDMPYYMGGGSVLIVVCTILDLKKQVRALSLTNPGGVRQ